MSHYYFHQDFWTTPQLKESIEEIGFSIRHVGPVIRQHLHHSLAAQALFRYFDLAQQLNQLFGANAADAVRRHPADARLPYHRALGRGDPENDAQRLTSTARLDPRR